MDKKDEVGFQVQIEIKGEEIYYIELMVKRVSQNAMESKFESIITINGKSERYEWITNDLLLLESHFTLHLQKLLSQYNPELEQITVVEDTHSLLTLQSAYCQHCGKKLYETYGHAFGVVKKCSNCGRLSFFRDYK
jgi:NADH pyrophosphatase NudC (nudix superfamily)